MVKTVYKLFGWAGVFLIAGVGAAVGGWVTNGRYPYQVLSRRVLTPVVAPGEPVEIEIEGFRSARCDTTVKRFVEYPDTGRTFTKTDYDDEYGRLGAEKFVLKIPTVPTHQYGKAFIYSYGESRCNPWEYLVPKSAGDPWIDQFEFGPETIRKSPEDVKPETKRVRE